MQQWTESQINSYLETLASNNTHEISLTLHGLAELDREPQPQPVPTGNAKVISHLEQLIEDHQVCVVKFRVPYTYGEMRWLAARVLACEYAYQGIEEAIILKDVIQPVTDADIVDIANDISASLKELIRRGIEPRTTEIIKPQDYVYCCSKEAVEERIRKQDKNE